jgi:hypothetical protein
LHTRNGSSLTVRQISWHAHAQRLGAKVGRAFIEVDGREAQSIGSRHVGSGVVDENRSADIQIAPTNEQLKNFRVGFDKADVPGEARRPARPRVLMRVTACRVDARCPWCSLSQASGVGVDASRASMAASLASISMGLDGSPAYVEPFCHGVRFGWRNVAGGFTPKILDHDRHNLPGARSANPGRSCATDRDIRRSALNAAEPRPIAGGLRVPLFAISQNRRSAPQTVCHFDGVGS